MHAVHTIARNTTQPGALAVDAAATWRVVASDLTVFASMALLLAAGKKPWPGLDQGQTCESLIVRSDTGAGADGAPFYIAFNRTDAVLPTDATADDLVSGSGQQFFDNQVRNVWIRKTVAGDRIFLRGRY